MTRIQKERFTSEEEYTRMRGYYRLTPQVLTRAKEKMIIMHPLPRVDEIRLDNYGLKMWEYKLYCFALYLIKLVYNFFCL